MEIKIVFNNDVINDSFSNGWGFSCLVDKRILFDTGEKGEYLLNNMSRLGIDVANIEAVVISHDHWDHTGGLSRILELNKGIKVYGCFGFSQGFKEKVKKDGGMLCEPEGFIKIAEGIYVTEEITGRYKGDYIAEQALVVKTERGVAIVVGCSHPGVLRIIDKVKEKLPDEKIHMILGGFHMMDMNKREIGIIAEKLKSAGVENVGPAHCTGYDAQVIFQKVYGDKCLSIKAGQIFEV
ncbi:MAG: MBL fold metallo-hydrolase [Candidatus Omnitrophica bacterium]|nr:MBL fold metallo-hydrolase [Candidatus Omnitrophota bacterium]